MMKRAIFTSILWCSTVGLCAAATPQFAEDVAPILNKYCVGCHSADDAEADLVLDSFDGLIRGGENGSTINRSMLADSLLVARVTGAEEPIMPPEDEPQPSPEEIAILVSWVRAGAQRPTEGGRPLPQFDRIEPSDGPKPITALAHRKLTSGSVALLSNKTIEAVLLESVTGKLDAPVTEVAPFRLASTNSPHRVQLLLLGGKLKVEEELVLPVRYLGDDGANDLTVSVSEYGKEESTQVPIYFGERFAVAHFGEVGLFEGIHRKLSHRLKTPGKVHSLCFSQDGNHLAAATGVAGLRGEAILWDCQDGSTVRRFTGHDDAVYALALSSDGTLLATGSYDRQIIIWDVATGERLRTLRGHNGAIYDLDFSPDGRILASASADTTIKIWNVQSGERLDTLGQPLKEQYSVDISPDGKYVIAGGEDNRLRMWRLVSAQRAQINPILHARFAHEGAIQQVRFDGIGNSIVTLSTDGTLKVWSTDGVRLQNSYRVAADSTEAMTVHGRSITLGRRSGQLQDFALQADEKWSIDQVAKGVRRILPDASDVMHEVVEEEPNDSASLAPSISIPAKIVGAIDSPDDVMDQDVFRFAAKEGEQWIIEVKAARDKSPLDSLISVVHADGSAIPRVQLQAVRDTYFTFRGKDSDTTGDFRLHNWEEMRLNQYLYCAGEVVKLFHYPRGPDSGFNVYPNFGKRRGFFDTTPLAHALHEPAYIVEPHPPGIELPPNGLPVFTLHYENDDDGQRRMGKDSRLTFVAPQDGEYCVMIRDVRGVQGPEFKYELFVRPPKPGFDGKILNTDPSVGRGSGTKIGVEVERIDGFSGPIDVRFENLPEGFSIAGPLQIEPQHDRLWATLQASDDVTAPSEEQSKAVRVVAEARIHEELAKRDLGSLGTIKVSEEPKLLVQLVADHQPKRGMASLPVIELKPGGTTTATIKISRRGHDDRVGFGKEDGAVNAPHGVYVDNIGLNGVLIVEGQDERQIFITAEPWVKAMERVIFVESGEAGRPTSNPVILRILPSEIPGEADQASR